MYAQSHQSTPSAIRVVRLLRIAVSTTALLLMVMPAAAQTASKDSIVQRITGAVEKLELTTNSSRILTLDKRIPRVQVQNPDVLSVTPLSATQVQISAKQTGVTQVNLWDEENNIHTVDVYVYGDVRELEHALKTQFPNSSVKVYRYSNSLVLTGFIDRPDYVDSIYDLASDYAPKVINNINVGGVQQVLLKVKVYEISRTKLRAFSADFAQVSSSGAFAASSVSGLLSNLDISGSASIVDTGGQTFEFAVTNGGDILTGWLEALQQRNVVKILAEPNLVAVSGRPAQFNEGGEIPVLIPQSLGQIAIEYKPFGTQVDFLPIVLGNGRIRLEVRPRISEIDDARSVTVNDIDIPALTVRQVDTAVEMQAGQTFAIAGLIQQRTESVTRGVPWLSDVPYLGALFRRVEDNVNEIELLVMVTPELVDAMDPHEVPACGPGIGTVSPSDCDLYMRGKIEVPDTCHACVNGNCGSCNTCRAGGAPGAPNSFVNGTGSSMHQSDLPYMEGTPTMAPTQADPSIPSEQVPAGLPIVKPISSSEADLPQYQAKPEESLVTEQVTPYRPSSASPTASPPSGPGLLGPLGYDTE